MSLKIIRGQLGRIPNLATSHIQKYFVIGDLADANHLQPITKLAHDRRKN